MKVSQNVAASAAYNTPAAAPAKKEREVSATRAAVEAQLAHNQQASKANADKLAKISGDSKASDKAAAATGAAATAASNTTANAAKAGTAANAADTKGTTATTETKKTRHSAIFEQQHAQNLSLAKINAAMLAKVKDSDTDKGDDGKASATAAQAATARYMENSGAANSVSSRTIFRA